MSIGRRETSNSRRRRLLVYQNCRDEVAETAADRRQFEKLREARRPSEIYGTSVNRRLRGRWFSLVPVRRRAMAGVAIAVMGIAALLCLGHWAAVAWQPLAYRPELARPLRLDRPDSFGAWVRAAFLAGAAGTSFLVYQLRRYRNDDFRGSYRIWPPVIVLVCLASLDAVCQLVPWGGELIELIMGRRVALAGSDWIRIVLTVGGIALAMRLTAEVRHSKLSIVMMLMAIVGFAIPMAARWGVFADNTPVRWLVITSSPMMASAALWVACGAYLRKLFREVRKMEAEDSLRLRMEQWRERIAEMRTASKRDKELAAESAKEAKPTRKVTKPPVKKVEKEVVPAVQSRPAVAAVTSGESDLRGDGPKAPQAPKESNKPRFSLRFWNRNRPAVAGENELAAAATAPEHKAGQAESAPVAKPILAKAAPAVAAPKPVAATIQNSTASSGTDGKAAGVDSDGGEDTKPKKGGLFGWFGKKNTTGDNAEASVTKRSETKPVTKSSAAKSGGDEDDDASDGDDPSIDWASMGKAERRRLRREMKRGGQAA